MLCATPPKGFFSQCPTMTVQPFNLRFALWVCLEYGVWTITSAYTCLYWNRALLLQHLFQVFWSWSLRLQSWDHCEVFWGHCGRPDHLREMHLCSIQSTAAFFHSFIIILLEDCQNFVRIDRFFEGFKYVIQLSSGCESYWDSFSKGQCVKSWPFHVFHIWESSAFEICF